LVTLTSNAIKFTHEGQISFSWTRTTDGVRITVKDTGQGMTPNGARRLEKIIKGSDTYDNEKISGGSTGANLGLTVASKLALLISPNKSKTMTFESNLGEGTQFHVHVEDQHRFGH